MPFLKAACRRIGGGGRQGADQPAQAREQCTLGSTEFDNAAWSFPVNPGEADLGHRTKTLLIIVLAKSITRTDAVTLPHRSVVKVREIPDRM
jgi:hypothetical protein